MDSRPPTVDMQSNTGYPLFPPTYNSPFAHQTMQAGPINNEFTGGDHMEAPLDVRDMIQREIEKSRIREEILFMEYYAHRRAVLEAEIRREILAERELYLQMPERYLPPVIPPSQSASSMMMHNNYPYGGYIGQSNHEVMPPPSIFNRFPIQPCPVEAKIIPEEQPMFQKPSLTEAKAPEVPSDIPDQPTSGKLLLLPKPTHPDLLGVKRKADEEAPGAEQPRISGKKKIKGQPQEWKCDLCQVTATSEKGLNDHLNGKKHKARTLDPSGDNGKKGRYEGQKRARNGKKKSGAGMKKQDVEVNEAAPPTVTDDGAAVSKEPTSSHIMA